MELSTALARQAYGQAKPATAPRADTGAQADFKQVAESFVQTLQQGEQTAQAALTTGADPHALVTALAETKLAVETAVAVRDKVVEAYQEILRMQV